MENVNVLQPKSAGNTPVVEPVRLNLAVWENTGHGGSMGCLSKRTPGGYKEPYAGFGLWLGDSGEKFRIEELCCRVHALRRQGSFWDWSSYIFPRQRTDWSQAEGDVWCFMA